MVLSVCLPTYLLIVSLFTDLFIYRSVYLCRLHLALHESSSRDFQDLEVEGNVGFREVQPPLAAF